MQNYGTTHLENWNQMESFFCQNGFPLNHWNRTRPSLRHLDHKCTAKQKDIADRRPQRKLYRNPGKKAKVHYWLIIFKSNPHKKMKMSWSWSSYEYEFQWRGGDSLVTIR